jgi:hypothetical protein
MSADSIDTGVYFVNTPCPRCGVIEEIVVALKSSLTTPQDEIGRLSVKLKSKPRDHDCKQARITVLAPAERLPEDGS